MDVGSARVALEVLAKVDVSVAGHGDLSEVSQAIAGLQSFVDVAKVRVHRRVGALAESGDRSSDHVLLDEARLTGRDARANGERDRVCAELPAFEDLLAAGGCTAGHLDVLARHTRDLGDEERADVGAVVEDLLGAAASDPVGLFDRKVKGVVDRVREMHRPDSDVEELDRQRQQSSVKRWTDRDSGMRHTHLTLDPIRDAALWNVIDHHLTSLRQEPGNEGRPFGELQVEAVLAAVSATGDARVHEVVVHADAASLCHGRHDDTVSETVDGVPLPVSTVQRLCCEAILQAVIVNPDGTVDRLCAEQRTASRAQRRMLAAMYSTCAHPHCQVRFSRCRIHHIVWWTRGGATVLANLLPLCDAHHHLVHEGGWHLTIDDRRRVTWLRPDHTIWHTDTGPNRMPSRRGERRTQPQHAA